MDEYARAAARVHAALGALQAAPEGSRGRYTDEFTQELYNARSVRKEHGLQRMPFIAQLTELIASCKPSGAYGLVPELFARAVVDVRSAPSMPYAGDLGPNQWWRAIPSASAPPPPAPASTYHAPPPPPMPIAGPSHQYQHAYPQHYARSLSPPPPPPPPPHGRKRTASAAQLDPRPEYGGGGRDKIKFEMWTGGQRADSSSGQSAGTAGASSSRAPAKYARYNPEEPGPPKGYELCTDEQSRCDRCRERGIECWKGRKRKRASGACWNCHKLKRPCSMAKDWFAAKPFAAMSEPYETEPGSVVVLQLNEAGRLLSPRAAALAEEQAYAQRQQQQQQAYASSSHAAYHGDRPSYAYPGRSDNSHRNGRARSSTYADSTPPDTAYSSPAPHPLPLPPIPDPYASHHASRRTSVSTPYAQHPRYYPPPPAEISPPPPPTNNVPLAIPPPPPPERITYSTHVQAPIPLDVPGDNGPRPIPPPPPPEQPHHHSAQRSATPHGSSSYTRSETSASAAASVPMVAQSASTSSQARSSSSQSHSSHEYPYASGPPPRYYDREPPPLPPPPERYREPADRYYDSPPPPRAGSGAYYERETYAAVYPPPPGYAYPPPDMYPRPGHYPPPPPPHPHPQAHGRYNPLVDARHEPYPYSPHDASRTRTYPPPLQPPPLADSRYAPQPYSASQLQYADTRSPYAHELRPVSRPPIRKRSESPPAIPPPPPLEWPDHPPRTAYERRRTSTRENSLKERDTVSRDRDTVAPEDDGDQVGRDDEARENGVRRDHGDTNGEASAERRDTNIDERARMLLASARSGTNGDVEMRTSSPTPVLASAASPELDTHRVDQRGRMLLAEIRTSSPAPALLLPEDKKSREHDRDKDVRSPRPSRTPISSPPPPPGSTGTHTPGSAAAAERPACARPPTSSASTASAGGGPSTPVADVYSSTPVADVHSSPPRGGTAKRPWLI